MLTTSAYGRLGRDPETRQTRNGADLVTSSLAVDVAGYGHDGDQLTLWLDLVAFGSTGEALARHQKGDSISVMGRMTLRRWVGRDGEPREGWSLTVDALQSSRTVRPGGRPKRREDDAGGAGDASSDEPPTFDDDDIPF